MHRFRLPRTLHTPGDIPADLARFERMYTVLLPWIIARSRRLSCGDRDLRDDLLQTALCALWELCRTGVPPFDVAGTKAYLHREMLHVRRAERRAGVVSAATARRWSSSADPVTYAPRRPGDRTRNATGVARGSGNRAGHSSNTARPSHNVTRQPSTVTMPLHDLSGHDV